MHIILTHEQADFDALASLVGAHLLNEAAVPVVPRRVNRNVRAFLMLYGLDLPLVDPRDLPAEPIEAVTLVDTQSLISVKGMGPETRIYVIDHHPPREDLPENWSLETEELGATTTLFVEALHERGCVLDVVQATLLLLGIYEDTGSLTYTRTTARDLRAVAFLVERGASLEIAAGFLRHPLSLAQQALYDHLRESTETHQVHGHTVVLALGDAREMSEEISTVAHKLRDLLEPDALFVLVAIRGGVQLIARSTSDNIDVGAIAAQFEGGGHERAAAALIHPRDKNRKADPQVTLMEARAALLDILPDHVQPAITVAQLMSRGPQVVAPDTPVGQVADLMQRYGYEGYPVVDSGQVIGLLIRRDVDRAMAHKLDMTASDLMKAGSVSIQPGDSIEHLQNLMIETGWGQIPVLDPASGEIIGIVTRTDLIKTMAAEPRVPGYKSLATRLEAALSPARAALLKAVADAALEQRAALYIVGGFVRDLLLEHPSLDFDLVVEGDAIALTRSLAARYGGRVTSHARFGTAKWHLTGARSGLATTLQKRYSPPGEAPLDPAVLPDTLDLITARTEFYTYPTALPTVARGSIKLDLHRRDFTINTLALRLDGVHYGELHDYWGGLNDLNQGFVRVLHSLSFVDDPTRMLRAVRFEERFGFRISERTLELLLAARPLIDRVSGDRIRHELDIILDEPHAARMLARLDSLGLLAYIHPDLQGDEWLYSQIESLAETEPEPVWGFRQPPASRAEIRGIPLLRAVGYTLWLLRLPEERVAAVARRLKLRSDLRAATLQASRLWRNLPSMIGQTPSRVVARLDGASPLALYAVYRAAEDPAGKTLLLEYVAHWRAVTPGITGRELQARGLPPGPAYRRILETLRAAWLDGDISTPEEEEEYLEDLLKENGI